jgi:hypothetical protein
MAGTMQVQVLRDACCSQDDQLGPLEKTYELSRDAEVSDLVRTVIGSGFLQYSSTHTSLTGLIGGIPFVKVFSGYHLPGKLPVYAMPAVTPLAPLIEGQAVEFRFERQPMQL